MTPDELTFWQWACALTGALLVGLAKGGVPGVGNLTVLLFAFAFEAKASVGLLLPVLISADIVAVLIYRRSTDWTILIRLLPWMLVGVVLGFFFFDRLGNDDVEHLIGGIVIAMTLLQVVRTILKERIAGSMDHLAPQNRYYAATLGIIGGAASMVANAAGPVGQLYLLSARLSKLAFIGTAAWLFFLVNLFKVPFQAQLGILSGSSLVISALVMPAAVFGALLAPRFVRHINERLFARLMWFFVIVAGVKLLFF